MSPDAVPVAAVGAVIVVDGEILLVQRAVEPGAGLWAVPGGRVDFGETWREAAQREVAEETGLEVRVGAVAWAGEILGAEHHYAIVDFHAEVVGGTLRAGSDARRARWIPIDEALDLPMPSTMYALLRDLQGSLGMGGPDD